MFRYLRKNKHNMHCCMWYLPYIVCNRTVQHRVVRDFSIERDGEINSRKVKLKKLSYSISSGDFQGLFRLILNWTCCVYLFLNGHFCRYPVGENVSLCVTFIAGTKCLRDLFALTCLPWLAVKVFSFSESSSVFL